MIAETWPFAPAVHNVIELLACGEYAAVERLSGGVRLPAEAMAAAIAEYGRRLVSPPAGAIPFDVVPHADGGGWSVNVPLRTAEEGRSDLTMQLTVRRGPGAAHRIEVDDIHVL